MDLQSILEIEPRAEKIAAEVRHLEPLLKTGALQSAVFNSVNFSSNRLLL